MEKDELPKYADVAIQPPAWQQGPRRPKRIFRLLGLSFVTFMAYSALTISRNTQPVPSTLSLHRLQEDFAVCAKLQHKPSDPSGTRDYNARWVNGTSPVLIRNATVWAPADTSAGFEWKSADVFVQYGLIQRVELGIPHDSLPSDVSIFDAKGRPLTTGIVDMHSHAGGSAIANLQHDENELSSDITPYVKSLDAIDPLQPEFSWIKSGGVTTTLILPGSGNNMGGEAFAMKTAVGNVSGRPELSQLDMFADPEHTWRYMKMACGENPKRVYGKVGERGPFSRMGEGWRFRAALEHATEYVKAQDDWCAAAETNGVHKMQSYLPQELEWESLGALLRGQIRLNTHCYTIPDLEMFVRLTNEFKFQVRAFHHAHQTYLVPEVLKRAWGPEPPASALFADNMYYKVESYTASEQAGKILHENGLVPIYVSDNPVLNSQHVVLEAAKAFRNGLPYHVALAGVTSQPARLLGLGNRVGKIAPGFDADILVWDSDPLSLGAAPVQVWIDGAPQYSDPVVLDKPWAKLLDTPVLSTYTSPSPLFPSPSADASAITIFTGLTHIHLPSHSISTTFSPTSPGTLILMNNTIVCLGSTSLCPLSKIPSGSTIRTIALQNGHLTTPFTAFGSTLGLSEIDAESATQDGATDAPLFTRTVDALALGGKQLAATYAKGVTRAVTAPFARGGGYRGVSALFKTGALNSLEEGAVVKEEVAVHYDLTLAAKRSDKSPSISSAVGALRKGLLDAIASNGNVSEADRYGEAAYLKRVVNGSLPLVLQVHSADTIAAVVRLKAEISSLLPTPASAPAASTSSSPLRIIIHGGAESHIVASALASAKIPVILAPMLAYGQSWDQRRSLTGAPLTNGTAIDALLAAGVKVAIGPLEAWEARDLPLMAGVALANGRGMLDYAAATGLIGEGLWEILGLGGDEEEGEGKEEWVLFEGSPLEIDGRLRASGDAGKIVVWE